MTTYAVYQRQHDGTILRLGTFRGPRGSVRAVTAAFQRQHPRVDMTTIRFSTRRLINGRYCDDAEQIPADPK